MGKGTGIVIGVLGIGAVVLLAKSASGAKPAVQKTYVDKSLEEAQKKAQEKVNPKVATVKKYAAKGTAEAQSAINAINKLLK